MSNPRKKLVAIAPFIKFIAGTVLGTSTLSGSNLVQTIIDICGGSAEEVIAHLDCVKDLSNFLEPKALKKYQTEDLVELPEEATGAAKRAFHQLLLQLDPSEEWGQLKRILDPDKTGKYFWLCPIHAGEYQKKLPEIP